MPRPENPRDFAFGTLTGRTPTSAPVLRPLRPLGDAAPKAVACGDRTTAIASRTESARVIRGRVAGFAPSGKSGARALSRESGARFAP